MTNIRKDLHVFLTERRPHGISEDAYDLVPTIRLEDLRELAKKELSNMLEKKECTHKYCHQGSECKECFSEPAINFIKEFFCISEEEVDEVRPKLKI